MTKKPRTRLIRLPATSAEAVAMANKVDTYMAGVNARLERSGAKSMEGFVFRSGVPVSLTEEDYQ